MLFNNSFHIPLPPHTIPQMISSPPYYIQDLPSSSNDLDEVTMGIDLDDYYSSTEWDLLAVPAKKYEKFYPWWVVYDNDSLQTTD